MSGSVEKQARKALRRVVFWRLVGDLFSLPQVLLGACQSLIIGLTNWFRSMEMAIFYFELEAARRYKLLTGVDLGSASHSPGRYARIMHPDLAEDQQREMFERQGEDEA